MSDPSISSLFPSLPMTFYQPWPEPAVPNQWYQLSSWPWFLVLLWSFTSPTCCTRLASQALPSAFVAKPELGAHSLITSVSGLSLSWHLEPSATATDHLSSHRSQKRSPAWATGHATCLLWSCFRSSYIPRYWNCQVTSIAFIFLQAFEREKPSHQDFQDG